MEVVRDEMVVQQTHVPMLPAERTVEEVIANMEKIKELTKRAMKEGVHFGVIPGTEKPALLQAGAQQLMLLYRMAPAFESTEERDGVHLTVKSRCTLMHSTTNNVLGSGEGSCSTKESRYAWRNQSRVCPSCGKEAIIKGKAEYGGGWVCFKKKNGCGAKFGDKDPAIVNQVVGRVPNEDIADCYNTVLKMANKRAMVAAVINVTGCSDVFTQDVEENGVPGAANGNGHHEEPAEVPRATDEQVAEFQRLVGVIGIPADTVREKLSKRGAATPADLDRALMAAILNDLRTQAAQATANGKAAS